MVLKHYSLARDLVKVSFLRYDRLIINTHELVISKNKLTVDGEYQSYYAQKAVGIADDVHYYVIADDNDAYYSIIFPENDYDTAIMLLIDDTDEPLAGTMILGHE